MKQVKTQVKEHKEVEHLVFDFYHYQQKGDVERVFHTILSPNLQQLTSMEKHSDKYQGCFKFCRTICFASLFSLTEITPGHLEGIVVLCLIEEGAKPSRKTKKYKEADKRFSAYKMNFIFLGENWYIDDITPYREFWGNEFKEHCNQ